MITWDWLKNKKPVDVSLKKRIEGEITLIYGKNLEICYLNKVGGQIVELSDGRNTLDDIAGILLESYDVDERDLQGDIIALIRELQWKRLIKLEEA